VTPIRPAVVDDHMVFREGLRPQLGRITARVIAATQSCSNSAPPTTLKRSR